MRSVCICKLTTPSSWHSCCFKDLDRVLLSGTCRRVNCLKHGQSKCSIVYGMIEYFYSKVLGEIWGKYVEKIKYVVLSLKIWYVYK